MRTCIWAGGAGCDGTEPVEVRATAYGWRREDTGEPCEGEPDGSPLREVKYAEPRYDPERGGLLTRTQPCRYVPSAVRRMRIDVVLNTGMTCRLSAAAVARAWLAHVQAVVEGRATPPLMLAAGEC